MDLDSANTIYEECAEILATKIFKHLDKSSDMTLDDIRKKISIKDNKKKINCNNWHTASCIAELLEFKNKDLKQILSDNNRKKSGNKKDLAKRVWDITHPETVIYLPNIPSNTPTNETYHIDDSSDTYESDDDCSDSDDGDNEYSFNIVNLIKTSEIIYLNKNKLINMNSENHIKENEYIYVSKKNWIFKEFDNYYKFMGILKEGTIESSIIPNELKEYYLQI